MATSEEVPLEPQTDLLGGSARHSTPRPKIALVNPPFGPGVLPNLGLSLLSASLRQRNFECRTFYWNLELVGHLTGPTFRERMRTFAQLTGRPWFPFNEWIFSDRVYGETSDRESSSAIREMRRRTYAQPRADRMWAEIVRLKEQSSELVSGMTDQLHAFDLIGISTTFLQNLPALALARSVKERWPEKKVMLGGANCDGEMGLALLRKFPFVDFTFTGEMDLSFVSFLESYWLGRDLQVVPGAHGRLPGGSIFSGPAAQPIKLLDQLPLPDFDDYVRTWEESGHAANHKLILALESSRGCWWGERQHCTFCGLNANGMSYRKKSDDRFITEVASIVRKYGTKFLYMVDNILPMQFYDHFMKWAQESDLGINFFYEIKSNVKRRHVEKMAASGVNSVQPGIESLSSNILRLMRKGVTAIHNVTFLRLAREYGILVAYNILVGFPGEDPAEYATMAREIPKVTHLQPPMAMAGIEFHRFSPYHSYPQEFGLQLRPSWHYKYLYPFDQDTVSRIAYVFECDSVPLDAKRYLKQLGEQLRRWGQSYRFQACTLTWQKDGNDVAIIDCRPGFGPRTYRLSGFAADLFLLLDEPRSLKSLVREANRVRAQSGRSHEEELPVAAISSEQSAETLVSFTVENFLADPSACLKPIELGGLVFTEDLSASASRLTQLEPQPEASEGKHYVMLPVPACYRTVQMGWLES